ncbi:MULTISPECIES: hypothetical protein [unclassified Mesorhizobium]|uniref:hypothetical protein n=1 Tax=unclassified Mesorhizobium TaxID=325217 RepID=UPI00112C8255|nr:MULTISPECIES: hypothetical protein [unclassified Mesorhizobium]TPL42628.1 hypothetical protein FJ961_08030 [Mesorhizobium sp. B2-4-5]TPL66631.1 hypothetical protein FJ949_09710 [Mesorhizobium sp. B2-4-1]
MAKIANLDVDTIKIGNAALTGAGQSSFSYFPSTVNASIPISNPSGNPITLYWNANGTCASGASSSRDRTASVTFSVMRGATTFYSNSVVRTAIGDTGVQLAWSGAVYDPTPGTSPVYSTTGAAGSTSPGVATLTGMLMAVYFKK